MIFNLYLVQKELSEYSLKGTVKDAPYYLNCEYAVYQETFPETLTENILYILSAKLMPSEPVSGSCTCSFLCIGCPPDCWLKGDYNVMYTEKPADGVQLLNRINAMQSQYRQWTRSLQEVVDQRLPMGELAIRSSQFTGCSIVAQGNGYTFLFAYARPKTIGSSGYTRLSDRLHHLNQTIMSEDYVNILSRDPDYARAAEVTHPDLYYRINPPRSGAQALFCNVTLEGKPVARLYFNEIIDEEDPCRITPCDYVYISVLAHYLGKCLKARDLNLFVRPREMDTIMDGLLSHRLLPEASILRVLHAYGWNWDDMYDLVVLSEGSQRELGGAMNAVALNLMISPEYACYTIFKGDLVIVYNLTRTCNKRKELEQIVLRTLNRHRLNMCQSAIFNDFKMLFYAYRQAMFARQFVDESEPAHIEVFDAHRSDYIIHKCLRKDVPDTYIPEGLLALIAYDREKGTEYTRLLRIYLECERNIAETVRVAFVSRSTLVYQLQKLESILSMDLNNPEVRFLLSLAFRMLEQESNAHDFLQLKRK